MARKEGERLSDADVKLAAKTLRDYYNGLPHPRDPYLETVISKVERRDALTAAQAQAVAEVLKAKAGKLPEEGELGLANPARVALERLARIYEDRSDTAHEQVKRDRASRRPPRNQRY